MYFIVGEALVQFIIYVEVELIVPVTPIVPFTSSLSFGFATPIPTFPLGISTLHQFHLLRVNVEPLVASSAEKFPDMLIALRVELVVPTCKLETVGSSINSEFHTELGAKSLAVSVLFSISEVSIVSSVI